MSALLSNPRFSKVLAERKNKRKYQLLFLVGIHENGLNTTHVQKNPTRWNMGFAPSIF
jgi:hypothetical protein